MRFLDDTAAVRLGHALFFDTRFSGNGQVSCGTCHQPGRQFQDGVPLAHGVGTPDRHADGGDPAQRPRAQLEAYLRTLSAPVNTLRWLLEPPHHPN